MDSPTFTVIRIGHALPVLLLLANGVLAQGGRILNGRILANGRLPASSAMEILVTTDGVATGSRIRAYPDSDGFFTIRGIAAASHYEVTIEVEGFEPVRERLESAAFSGGVANIVLLLRPRNITEGDATNLREGAVSDVIDLRQLQIEIPADANRAYERAIESAENGDFEGAASRLEEALKLAPEFYEAQNNLGVQYQRLGRNADAIRAFERAIELNPNETRPRVNLAVLYMELGEAAAKAGRDADATEAFAKATDALRVAVRLDPLSPAIHYHFGSALYGSRAYDEVETELARALELDPGLETAELVLINVYTRLRKYDAALDAIDAFLESHPDTDQRRALEEIRSQINTVRK